MVAVVIKTLPIFDYELVSYLAVHDVRYSMQPVCEESRGGRIEVCFYVQDTPDVRKLIAQFHEDVSVQKLLDAMHQVKDKMMPIVRGIRNGFILPRSSVETRSPRQVRR